jgi:predicted nucleic acid-binding protein
VEATGAEVVARLRALCESPGHQFWPDEVSLLDGTLFRPDKIAGHQKITDAYLLGLAVRRGARLATFDRSIPLKAVIGATADSLELLGGYVT